MKGSLKVKKRERESNIELLRIFAIFMVLIGHANGLAFGLPNSPELAIYPIESISRIFFSSLGLSGVNLFVLISGWFGITFSKKGIAKFIFELLFLIWGVYLFALLTHHVELKESDIKILFGLTGGYWFVMAYLGLYIFSPVLNAFVEKVSERQFRFFLIAFYSFQCFYSWITGYVNYFEGYSIFFFSGLYLTARYFRLYPVGIIRNRGALIYIFITCLLSAVVFLSVSIWGHAARMLRYDNPVEIIACIGLLYAFSEMRIRSKIINWVAASSFAVYIIHFNPIVFPYFLKGIKLLSTEYNGVFYVFVIGVYLIMIFFVCVLIDQIRKWAWYLINVKF